MTEYPLNIKVQDKNIKIVDITIESGKNFVKSIETSEDQKNHKILTKSLNPGDSFELLLFTEGNPNPNENINLDGKIINGKIRISKSPESSYVQEFLSALIKVFIFAIPLIFILFYSFRFILMNIFKHYGPKLISLNFIVSAIIGILFSIIIAMIILSGKKKAISLDKINE